MLRNTTDQNETLDWVQILADPSTTELMRDIYAAHEFEALGPILCDIENTDLENLRLPNSYGLTLLHLAAFRGNPIIIAALLEKGVDVNARDNFNWTPLHFATYISNETPAGLMVANILLNRGADPNLKSKADESPFHNAIPREDFTLIKTLVENGADLSSTCRGQRALQISVKCSNKEITEYLLSVDCNIDFKDRHGCTALHLAIINQKDASAKTFITHGADVNAKDNNEATPLHMACKLGMLEIVKLLIEKGANINERNANLSRALTIAIEHDNSTVAEHLIACKADLKYTNHDRHTPLHIAVLQKNDKIAKLILEKNSSLIDMQDIVQKTALAYACFLEQPAMVKLLLEHGARVDVRDKEQGFPLHAAAKVGNSEIMTLLLSKYSKQDLNAKNCLGETPLFIAVHAGNHAVAQLLMASGADPYEQTKSFETILHAAVRRNHPNLVKLLLNNHVKPNERILELSRKNNPPEIVKLIEDAIETSQVVKKTKEKKIRVQPEEKAQSEIEGGAQALIAAMKKQKEEEWLAQERVKKQQEEELRKQEALKRHEEKAQLEQKIRALCNEIYDIFSEWSETKKIFTRREKVKTIDGVVRSQESADRKAIAKAMMVSLGIDKGSKLFATLLDRYLLGIVPESPEPPAKPVEPVIKNHDDSEKEIENIRKMQLNKELYRLEKEHETAAAQRRKESQAASSSSSSALPKIGMRTQEEAARVRGLVNELSQLAEKYLSVEKAKKIRLYEMKHDLLKMSAFIMSISDSGAKPLIDAIFKNTDEIKVLRNGTLHLLEINSEYHAYTQQQREESAHEFYLAILVKLSALASLKNGLETGLNTVLKNIQAEKTFPLNIQSAFAEMNYSMIAQETYVKFESNYRAWQADPDLNQRSDVLNEIHQRMQILHTPMNNLSHQERVMFAVEIAELYRQGANAGIRFTHFPKMLIDLKNDFTHRGIDIPDQQIDAFLNDEVRGSISNGKYC